MRFFERWRKKPPASLGRRPAFGRFFTLHKRYKNIAVEYELLKGGEDMLEKRVGDFLRSVLPYNSISKSIVQSVREIVGDCFFASDIFIHSDSKCGIFLILDEEGSVGFADADEMPKAKNAIFIGTPFIRNDNLLARLDSFLKRNQIELLKWRDGEKESPELVGALNDLRKDLC